MSNCKKCQWKEIILEEIISFELLMYKPYNGEVNLKGDCKLFNMPVSEFSRRNKEWIEKNCPTENTPANHTTPKTGTSMHSE
ncbi:hypothetical protein FACS189479_05460 [Spirochaetia bacterium]|nr:hypothetical protein FACS189479_05460 [Spirochaetia bacterium]